MVGANIIKPLHGLRGIAAMTVVFGHLAPIKSAPALGVVLFFVLSGFLMGKLYLEQSYTSSNVWNYVVGRVARVYPLFAVVIVGTAILNEAFGADIFGLRGGDVAAHLALAGPAKTVWTISAEFQFYGIFIPIWALRSRLPSGIATTLPLLLGAIAVMLVLGTDAGRINIFGYLHIFVLGLITAQITALDTQRWANLAGWMIPLLGGAYAVAFLAVPYFYNARWIYMDLPVVAVCGALIAATIIARDCWANRILSFPPFLWLGEISFGAYLLHRHAQWAVDQVAGDLSQWATFPIKVALTLLLAQAAYMVIETPSRRILRRLGTGIAGKVQKA